jgi:transcriptional regulator with XRE-family HTH domain
MTGTQSDGVADNVRAVMQRKGKSQADLAAVLHLSQSAISRRLVGDVAFNTLELRSLAEYLGVSVTSLIRERAVA